MALVARRNRVAPAPAGPDDTIATRAGRTARAGLWGIARIVGMITTAVVGLILLGILLVLLDANTSNSIVNAILDAGRWLTSPFDGFFTPDGHKAEIAANWGLAAGVYALAGALIMRLLRR
jgi:hypothetical protein